MKGGQIGCGDDGRLSLSGVLSFVTVPDIWTRARPLIEAAPRVTVDLKGVTRSESAGLALLIECMRVANRSHKEIAFLNMPDQMMTIARVTGLDGILPRPKDG